MTMTTNLVMRLALSFVAGIPADYIWLSMALQSIQDPRSHRRPIGFYDSRMHPGLYHGRDVELIHQLSYQ